VARDYEIQSKQVAAIADNPDGFDVAGLRLRVKGIIDEFTLLIAPLDGAISDAETLRTQAAVETLRSRLGLLADAGYAFALPQSSGGCADAESDILATRGKSVSKRPAAMTEARAKLIAKADAADTKPPQRVSALVDAARLMLGDDFALLPRFSFNNPIEVAAA